MNPDHPDYADLKPVRDAIIARLTGDQPLEAEFPVVVASAVDYVLDPIRTGRTSIGELDNVEKTVIGLKVEHFIRDWLDVPAGIRDLKIGDHDVDVKNTIGGTWMIPQETYAEVRGDGSEPGGTCLVIQIDEAKNRCSLGLLRVRDSYLNAPNRDKKRGVSSAGRANVMWVAHDIPYQEGHWQGFDMARFRQLRAMKGGNNRVVAFFGENLGRPIDRSVVMALLHDQLDAMKRLRWNGGAKGRLWEDRIVLLSGEYFSRLARALGHAGLERRTYLALQTRPDQQEIVRQHGYLEGDT